MKAMRKTIFILTVVTTLLSCSPDNGGSTKPQKTQGEITLTVSDTTWTYVSLRTGQVVGTSSLLDTESDARWASRTDWDFALCGDMIRTNGGTSGKGDGGVQNISNLNFAALDTAPVDGYVTDTDDVVVKR